jgi:phosphoribosyl-ATP pyrophosphohydrolase
MMIPSIDVMGGQAVQLIGGEEKALDAGDPRPLAERFGRVGEVAVVDLDAALGQGENTSLIEELLERAPCRVGGGIRDVEAARRWLDRGAAKVVLGTAARPEVLRELPSERVVAALDARHGEVVVEGWRTGTGAGVLERMQELGPYVGGFLVTFVEREGRFAGVDAEAVGRLLEAAAPLPVTVAGGVTTAADVADLDALGAEAQVGMALYTGRLGLAEGFLAPLARRVEPPWPTVVADARGVALGLAWSDTESVTEAIERGAGVYHSRRRGLWVKGETSGATQRLARIDLDCDRDALRFTVRQRQPGFCHRGTWTCWGEDAGLGRLARRLAARAAGAPEGSYTRRLLDEPDLLAAKLAEEAGELAQAEGPAAATHEAADLIYFACVALVRAGVPLEEVEGELDRRALRVGRRPGNAKPPAGGAEDVR